MSTVSTHFDMITSVALVILVITSVPALFIIVKLKFPPHCSQASPFNFVIMRENEKIFPTASSPQPAWGGGTGGRARRKV